MKFKVLVAALAFIATSGCVYADSETVSKVDQVGQAQVIQPVLARQSAESTAGKTESVTSGSLKKPQKQALSPDIEHAKAAIIVSNILTRFEYDKKPLDTAMSHAIFDEYLKMLDPSKMFFLQSDIEKFSAVKDQMNDMLLSGRLEIPFDIFEIYRDRVEQRFDHVLSTLKDDFDFSVDESFELDRKKSKWVETNEEINDLWRKRVKNDYLRLKLAGSTDQKIKETLSKRYINNRNQILRMSSEDVSEMFINAYASSTDPHTNYYSPTSAKNFDVQISLSVEGIGAVLQKRDEYGQIREVVPGGPAAKSGQIQPGDRIVAVGQGAKGPMEDVVDWRLDDIVNKIRGKRGSTVRIEIIPAEGGIDGKQKVVTLVRQKVTLEDQAAKYKILDVENDGQARKVAVITIPSFYEDFDARARGEENFKSVTRDVRAILEELNKANVDGIVLDMRNNGGGSLTEAANLSGLFIGGPSPIVQVRTAEGSVSNVRSMKTDMVWDKPLAVLVNRISASASEIFAGAMQDYGRGVVLGDPTWGKGSVQTIRGLNEFLRRPQDEELGSLKWTIQKFFRVNGSSTQVKGIVPDIIFPTVFDAKEMGESSYENAMPWTEIDPASYKPVGDLKPTIVNLARLHKDRVNESGSWKLMQDELDYARKLSDQKVISLNYQTRLEERENMETQRKDFEARRKELGESDVGGFRLDDGLQAGEGNLKEELANEKKRKDNIDIAAKEAANIVADMVNMK